MSNRIHGLLTQIHPSLERVLGPKIQHNAALEVLIRLGGPEGTRTAGGCKLRNLASKHAPRKGAEWAEQIWQALSEQSVTVPSTATAEIVLGKLVETLKTVLAQRNDGALRPVKHVVARSARH